MKSADDTVRYSVTAFCHVCHLYTKAISALKFGGAWVAGAGWSGAGQNIPGQNIPCHFFTPRTKHPTKICHPGQNIPRCFCHPGHNIPCHFCHPGHNIPCHFCHPGQSIPYSDCFFRVSLICDLHLLWHVLALNALVWLSKWYKLGLKLIERQFHNVNRI